MVLHPAIQVKSFSNYGFPCKGLFVKPNHRIKKGEHVWWLGNDEPGRVFTKNDIVNAPTSPTQLAELAAIGTCNDFVEISHDITIEHPRDAFITYCYMVEDDCFLSTPWPNEDESYYYNHSCDPNTGYRGDDLIVALRDIEENEQVVYDYGFTETQDSLHRGLICKCGSKNCRGVLTMLQYKDPDFIQKHFDNCTSFIQRKMRERGWHHDSVVRRHCFDSNDWGLFALDPIPRLTTVNIYSGKVVAAEHVLKLSREDQRMSLQIDTDLWQIPSECFETGDFMNHSCSPNCGMKGSVHVVTMRDIAAGEQLTLDYAMVTSVEMELFCDRFSCLCGTAACRRVITGQDYKTEGLRYFDFLSPFVRERYLKDCPGRVPIVESD